MQFHNLSNTTAPSPQSHCYSFKCADFTDTSIYVALGVMGAITLFVCVLSVVSKQMERRHNLSHFDDVFMAHNDDEDLEAQVDLDATTLLPTPSTTVASSPDASTKDQPRQTTALTDCAAARTFTMNLNPMLGSKRPQGCNAASSIPLPTVGELCAFDMVIVDSKVQIMPLIEDSNHYQVHQMGQNTAVRPRYLCRVPFATLASQPSSYLSTLLHKGFDGIVVSGVEEALAKRVGNPPPHATRATVQATTTHAKDWMDTIFTHALEVTTSLQVPLIVEIDQAPLMDFDLTLVNGVLFRNPTMLPNGQPRRVWGENFDKLERFVFALKKHVSMSIDFTLLALNVVDKIDHVLPEQLLR